MNKHLLLFGLAFGIYTATTAQQKAGDSTVYDKGAFGLGIGFDYGGLGFNYTLYPQKNIGIFGGVGYAIAGVGYNTGLKFRLTPKRVTPYIMGMYGYYAAISVTNSNGFGPSLNKMFYGFTSGVGIDCLVGRARKNYLSFALTIPFRSPDVQNYINDLRSSGVVFPHDLSPLGFSIGYKIVNF